MNLFSANTMNKKHVVAILAILITGAIAAFFIVRGGHQHADGDGHDHAHAPKAAPNAAENGAKGAPQAARPAAPDTVALSEAQLQAAAITLATAGGATLTQRLQLPGEIRLNEDRTAHVVPRIAGVVESVAANLGQQVRKGQVLAVIASTVVSEQRSEHLAAQRRLSFARSTYEREKKLWEEKITAEQDYLQAQQALREAEIALANAQQKLIALGAGTGSTGALNRFELRAPFDGQIIEKHVALGEAVKEDAQVFTLSDLSSVWAEVSVSARDLPLLRVGEKAVVKAASFDSSAAGTVVHIGALIGEQTRTARARIVLENPRGTWRPGLFVSVLVSGDAAPVAVAVPQDAVQTVEGRSVVFVRAPAGFIARPVVTGRSDGALVEIVSGLAPGTSYAAGNSFILKSELGKSSAGHAH